MGRLSRATSPLTIFTIATVLGVLTGLQAYNYVALTAEHKQPFNVLLALNLTYWWSWAVLVPGVLWMARHYRFERNTWRRALAFHVLGVVVFTAAHVALATSARGVILTQLTERTFDWWMYFRDRFFLNFDWEMMTYWALVGLRPRARLSARVAGARDRGRATADTAGRGAARGAAAPAASALPVQHAEHHLRADAPRCQRGRRDARAAQRPAPADARSRRHAAGPAHGRSRLPQEVSGDRTDAIRRSPHRQHRHRPEVLDAPVPNLVLQPLVENSLRHGIGPRVGGGPGGRQCQPGRRTAHVDRARQRRRVVA